MELVYINLEAIDDALSFDGEIPDGEFRVQYSLPIFDLLKKRKLFSQLKGGGRNASFASSRLQGNPPDAGIAFRLQRTF